MRAGVYSVLILLLGSTQSMADDICGDPEAECFSMAHDCPEGPPLNGCCPITTLYYIANDFCVNTHTNRFMCNIVYKYNSLCGPSWPADRIEYDCCEI